MAIIGSYQRLTADSSGDATMSVVQNGLVTLVHVSPVGSVNAGSTAALKQDFVSDGATVTRTVVAATACNVAVDIWDQAADGLFSIAKNRTLKVIIDGATLNDKFDAYVDVLTDD